MTTEYVFSPIAAIKVLLHAARHPSAPISGLLLTRERSSGDAQVAVVDAIPLFHTHSIVGPCLETAIVEVLSHASQNGQRVMGYYEADPRMKASELSLMGNKIGDRLLANGCAAAFVCVVDNVKFGLLLRQEGPLPFELFTKDGERWKRAIAAGEASLTCHVPDLSVAINRQLAKKVHYALSDFDDHLDDLTRDWTNSRLELAT